jgi:hypothetical protein
MSNTPQMKPQLFLNDDCSVFPAIVDNSGRALCNWVSDGKHCLKRASHVTISSQWFLCCNHANEIDQSMKVEMIELKKEGKP